MSVDSTPSGTAEVTRPLIDIKVLDEATETRNDTKVFSPAFLTLPRRKVNTVNSQNGHKLRDQSFPYVSPINRDKVGRADNQILLAQLDLPLLPCPRKGIPRIRSTPCLSSTSFLSPKATGYSRFPDSLEADTDKAPSSSSSGDGFTHEDSSHEQAENRSEVVYRSPDQPTEDFTDLSPLRLPTEISVLNPKSNLLDFFPLGTFRLKLTRFLLLPGVEFAINYLVFLDWLILALVVFESTKEGSIFPTFLGVKTAWPFRLRYVLNGISLIELALKTYAYGLVFSPYRILPEPKFEFKGGSRLGVSSYPNAPRLQATYPPPILFLVVGSIDLVSVAAFWTNTILSLPLLEAYGWARYPLFVALGTARPLRLLSIVPQFSSILSLVSKFVPILKNLAFFLAYFSLLFATLGLVLFKGQGHLLCESESKVMWNKHYCTGHYVNPSSLEIKYIRQGEVNHYKPLFSGLICPYPAKCVAQSKESTYLNFNNLFYSLLTVYVISSVESWAEIMYRLVSTVSPWTSMFFISCVMVLNYCLVTLFVAVIASIFENIREEEEEVRRLESKAYAPSPTVEAGFEFGLLQPPRKSDIPGVCNNVKLKIEGVTLKALPLLGIVAHVLIGVDLLVRSYYTGSLIGHPHVCLTINALLLLESALQLLRLRQPSLLRITNHAIGIRWMCTGICLHFILCLAAMVASLYAFANQGFPLQTEPLLNIFPVLRFYRLPLSIPRIQTLLCVLAVRVSGILSLMGFILASILLIAPIGMQLICLNLDGQQHASDALAYFGSLRYTMLALFQIFTGEDWPEMMGLITSYTLQPSHLFVIVFFVAWSGFSNLILHNLFIAQTMGCFELPEARKRRCQIKHYVDSATKASVYRQRSPISPFNPYRYLTPAPAFIKPFDLPNSLLLHIPYYLANSFMAFVDEDSKVAQNLTERQYISVDFDNSHPMYDTSWCMFRPGHPLRRFCQQLTKSNYMGYSLVFNLVVWAAVLAAVGLALVNTPQFRHDKLTKSQEGYLLLINLALAAFFLFEFAVRTIAHGFLLTPNAYLKHPWYIVEFAVLLVFLVDAGLSRSPTTFFSQFVCGLKALRALRLMSLVPKLKDTIYGVFIVGFPRVLDVSLLLISLIVPCAFYGHLLFARHGFSCSDPSIQYSSSCFDEFMHPDSGVLMPRVWNNYYKFSFATIGSSMLVLFEILSGEKWVKVVDNVMNFSSEDFTQPTHLNWWHCLYFVFYYMVGSIIVMSVFVAVIIENYRRYTGAAGLTSSQRHWIDLRKQLLQTLPSLRPAHGTMPLQLLCRRWATAKDGMWSNLLSAAHALLLLCLVTEFNGQGWNVSRIKGCVRALLLLISLVDHVIRILGLGLKTLRHSLWNSAHALVTGVALVLTLLSIYSKTSLFVYDLSNILTLAVTLKLMFRFNRLSELAKMASASLPSILMTLYAWFVLLVTYSILFMQIFGLTRHGEEGSDIESFRTFGFTFLMLFRMTTGENWNNFMHDYTVQEPFCVNSRDYLDSDCGSPALAYILFLSFNMLSMFIFTNLFVIIVIDSFNYCHDTAASFTLLTRADLRHFKHTWSLFDHHARGFIPSSSLVPFFMSLKPPFNICCFGSEFKVKALLGAYPAFDPADANDLKAYLRWLEEKLAHMPRQRRRFNIIYLHAMSLEEPGKGVSFSNIVLLLSQYKLIDPDQCMSIQDLLQFKRIQSDIHNLYYAEKALGLCRTLILRRSFLKRRASLAPPKILINEPSETHPRASDSPGGISPATSTSSYSWCIAAPPAPICAEASDPEEQDVLASRSPWAIALDAAVQRDGEDGPWDFPGGHHPPPN